MSPQKIPPKGLALLFIGVAMAVLLVVIGKQKCSYFSFGYCSHLQHSWVRYPNDIKLLIEIKFQYLGMVCVRRGKVPAKMLQFFVLRKPFSIFYFVLY